MIEVHIEVAPGKLHAAGYTVADCCKMVWEVRHVVLDLLSESLTTSRIEARML